MIQWNKELSVGNSDLDGQHQKLVALINELQEKLFSDISTFDINKAILEMFSYTEEHLAHEEELMRKASYPGYIDHKHKHDDFREEIMHFKDTLDGGGEAADIARDILYFLQRWLVTHIKGSDRDYMPFLADS
jgi:hemerythrin